jgi:hypothetical protein
MKITAKKREKLKKDGINRYAAFNNNNEDEDEDMDDDAFLPSDDNDYNIPPEARTLLVSTSTRKYSTKKKYDSKSHLKSTSNKKPFAKGQSVLSDSEYDKPNNMELSRHNSLQNEKRKAINASIEDSKKSSQANKTTKQRKLTSFLPAHHPPSQKDPNSQKSAKVQLPPSPRKKSKNTRNKYPTKASK